MALPPPEIVPALDADRALAVLRQWSGFALVSDWPIVHADVRAFSGQPLSVAVHFEARNLPGLAVPVLVVHDIRVDAPTRTVVEPDAAEAELSGVVHSVRELAQRAGDDGDLAQWIEANAPVAARLEYTNNADHLLFFPAGDEPGPSSYRFFPPIPEHE